MLPDEEDGRPSLPAAPLPGSEDPGLHDGNDPGLHDGNALGLHDGNAPGLDEDTDPGVRAGEPGASARIGVGRAPTFGLLWWATGAVIVLDQITKLLVQSRIALFDSVTVVPGLVDFVHIHNAGVAFGFLNDLAHPYRSAFTTLLALAALVAIAYYARQVQPEERLARAGLSLVLGGAVGNLIDRLRLGYVVDFIDVYWGDWHFWAFNVADAAITCGAVLILIELFVASRHASHPR